MTAASLSDWESAGCLGVAAAGLVWLAIAFVDAEPADFDPRPVLARLVESGRVDPLLNVVCNAKTDAREAVADARLFAGVAVRLSLLSARDAAITAAALHMLLSPNPEAAR